MIATAGESVYSDGGWDLSKARIDAALVLMKPKEEQLKLEMWSASSFLVGSSSSLVNTSYS